LCYKAVKFDPSSTKIAFDDNLIEKSQRFNIYFTNGIKSVAEHVNQNQLIINFAIKNAEQKKIRTISI
jgi:uncharacterized protein YkvS